MAKRYIPPFEATLRVNSLGQIILPIAWQDWFRNMGGRAAEIGKVTDTFTQTDLAAGVYTFNHRLGRTEIIIQIYNESYKQMTPDDITLTDIDNAAIDVTSWGDITGKTFTVIGIG